MTSPLHVLWLPFVLMLKLIFLLMRPVGLKGSGIATGPAAQTGETVGATTTDPQDGTVCPYFNIHSSCCVLIYHSGYPRSRSPPSRRSRSPPRYRRSRSPPPRRFSSGRRSRSRTRSPHYRRAYSPRGRPRASSRSRTPPPRSPPSKRLKLGNHSISNSPRTPRGRSRSHIRSPSRTPRGHSRSRGRSPSSSSSLRRPSNVSNKTPPHPPTTRGKYLVPPSLSSPISPKRRDTAPPHPIHTTSTHNNESAVTVTPKVAGLPMTKVEEPLPTISSSRDFPKQSTPDPLIIPEAREAKMEITKDEPLPVSLRAENIAPQSSSTPTQDVKIETRGRSHSPPKGPRAFQWRKSSKTPPKGPRNPGSSTPSMVVTTPIPPAPPPAAVPVYPTGPRADRRTKDQSESSDLLHSSKYTSIPPIAPERWTRISNFALPDMGLVKMEAEVN